MGRSLYLVNPASDFPTYFSAEVFTHLCGRPAAYVADLAIATIAALAPPDLAVQLCDQNLGAVDFDSNADYVGITGKITQREHLIATAAEFRRRGKVVIIGGPHASLSPEELRPHCDILVRGEVEEIAATLFADLAASRWKDEYVGTRPDLGRTPLPRFDLYPNDRALLGAVQTARGCPFECEFCDVIPYLGRKQRHKPIDRVLAELDQQHRLGYRHVFLADDNFTAYRGRARELLAALRDWNARHDEPLAFTTQVSLDGARDEPLLKLCGAAGLYSVFVGIETPNEESLREAKKRQNLRGDMLGHVQRFLDHGIMVSGGMIVGFDNDDAGIFERQYEFAMASPIPIFSLGALVAPAATPLHARLLAAGRLTPSGSEVAAMPWSTNIVPQRMTRSQLLAGVRWLCNQIYQPHAFGERVLRFIDAIVLSERRAAAARPRSVDMDAQNILARFRRLGPEEAKVFGRIAAALARKPAAATHVAGALLLYMQIRHMYDEGQVWQPMTAGSVGASPALIA